MLYSGNEGTSIVNGNILPIHCFGHGFLSLSHARCSLTLKHILLTPHATFNLL